MFCLACDGVPCSAAGWRRSTSRLNRCNGLGTSVATLLARGVSRSARSVPAAGVPVAGHVGLAEADLGVGCESGEERVRSVDDHQRVAAPPAPIELPSGNWTRSGSPATARRMSGRAMAPRSGARGGTDSPRQFGSRPVFFAAVSIVAVFIADPPGAWLRPTAGPGGGGRSS